MSASNAGTASAMNAVSAASLMMTRMMLSVALSRVPAISMPAIASDTTTAGRLMMPPACGPASSISGRATPADCSQPTR